MAISEKWYFGHTCSNVDTYYGVIYWRNVSILTENILQYVYNEKMIKNPNRPTHPSRRFCSVRSRMHVSNDLLKLFVTVSLNCLQYSYMKYFDSYLIIVWYLSMFDFSVWFKQILFMYFTIVFQILLLYSSNCLWMFVLTYKYKLFYKAISILFYVSF